MVPLKCDRKWTQGDSRNVSRPLARILMEANIGHLPTKFGHNQMQGWKVINRYRILQVNFHIWPHLTFDLLMWPLTPEYHGGQHEASTTQGWLQTDARLESYQPLQTFTFDLIWPLTYLCDLWPQNIMEANIRHLPTKFGYKQMQSWKVIQVFCKHQGRTGDGGQTDGRTQFGSLSLPSTSVGSTKTTFL